MKNFITLISLLLSIIPAFSYSTQASKFAEKQYEIKNDCKAHINSKKEYTFEYQQIIEEASFIPAITYGYGDMRINNKKCRISYMVVLDKKCQPFWSSIYFYEK